MNRFSRLSIRTKLMAGFVLVALIATIIGVVGLTSLNRVYGMAQRMHDIELRGVHQVGRADAELRSIGREFRGALLLSGAQRDAALRSTQEHFKLLSAALQEVDRLFVTEQGRAEFQQLQRLVREYDGLIGTVTKALTGSGLQSQVVTMTMAEATPKANEALAQADRLMKEKLANAQHFKDGMLDIENSTLIAILLLTFGGVLVSLLLGYLFARSVSRQLGGEPAEVAGIAASIAKGDLSVRIDTEGAAPGSIMANMAAMQASLRRLVGSVLSSSNSIASGASQITAGNTDLSQRTEEQAANLTQTASAMEELSGTVQSNADVARQAAQRAISASRSAENGGEVVGNVIETMAGITDSSKRIVDIISVIDSIAFQTNILALNAAVEAARAGEQGRGFAVVASEVRSLAQKSAAAAKDIKTLIDDSVHKVEEGSRLVDTAGETMKGIVSEVKQVTDLISEISAATSEQTSGISQVNDAVLQLSDVTQQNAALVEQSAAASASLNEQAQRLVELVRTFKLEAGQSSARNGGPQVITVPPATIEEGQRRAERPAPAAGRGNGAAKPQPVAAAPRGNGAAASPPSAPSGPDAAPARRPAPALGGGRPPAAKATAASGKSIYGSSASKEDDWEEF